MKVLLYDDHIFVTEAIAAYFTAKDPGVDIDQCQTISAVKECLTIHVPDIIISDVLSDEDAGFSLFHHILQTYPGIKIIAYTSISNSFIIQSLLDLDVSRVINKKESLAHLWAIVLEIYEDNNKQKNIGKPLIQLTSREKEIVLYLKEGFSAKEIGDLLGTSVNTINNQKNTLLEKFECTNSTDLVIRLAQMGLISVL